MAKFAMGQWNAVDYYGIILTKVILSFQNDNRKLHILQLMRCAKSHWFFSQDQNHCCVWWIHMNPVHVVAKLLKIVHFFRLQRQSLHLLDMQRHLPKIMFKVFFFFFNKLKSFEKLMENTITFCLWFDFFFYFHF